MKKLLFLITLAAMSIFANAADYDAAKRDDILKEISGAKISSSTKSILKFGAKGDGKKD